MAVVIEIIIKAAKETNKIITVEEHSIIGGLGSAVCDVVSAFHPVRVVKIGVTDKFGESGKPEEVLVEHGLTVEHIYNRVRQELNEGIGI